MRYKILVVCANYYKKISKDLYKDVQLILNKEKINYKKIDVPGVFELPIVIAKKINQYDGFIALGCVIKGQTPHFDFISRSSIDAIMKLSVKHKKPIGNCILTCLNISQAQRRSNPKGKKRKGKEAAEALISLLKI